MLFEGVLGTPDEGAQPTDIGFYWTEGNGVIGWTPDPQPVPLEVRYSLSIPSPPAIWHKSQGPYSRFRV